MNILCPVCKKILIKNEKTFSCENNHSFDIASQGYINLNLKSSQKSGDNPLMINARTRFLNKDYYRFLLEEVNTLLKEDDVLVDLACGEGYYTSRFICKDKTGIDLSKSALKHASKNDKTSLYILSSIFRCPLSDLSADKVITIFAPIAKEEIERILKINGEFILVKPDVYHLYELKEAIYDHPYLNEVEDIQIDGLELIREIPIRQNVTVSKEDLLDLLAMTPYYNTTSETDKEKLLNYEELNVTFSFLIDIYRKPGC